MKKTAGRPKIVVDIPKIVELTNAGLGAQAIAKELGVSPSVVHRAQKAAQNEGVLIEEKHGRLRLWPLVSLRKEDNDDRWIETPRHPLDAPTGTPTQVWLGYPYLVAR